MVFRTFYYCLVFHWKGWWSEWNRCRLSCQLLRHRLLSLLMLESPPFLRSSITIIWMRLQCAFGGAVECLATADWLSYTNVPCSSSEMLFIFAATSAFACLRPQPVNFFMILVLLWNFLSTSHLRSKGRSFSVWHQLSLIFIVRCQQSHIPARLHCYWGQPFIKKFVLRRMTSVIDVGARQKCYRDGHCKL